MRRIAITLIMLLSLMTFSCGQILQRRTCSLDNFETVNTNNVKEEIQGNWAYKYSIYRDTCFVINELGDLPIDFNFKRGEDALIKSENPKLYDFGKEKMLFGIVSSSSERPRNNYPIARSLVRRNKSDILEVIHYENGLGKAYFYFLEYLTQEHLVIFNERNYELNDKSITAVRHVYKKYGTK